ncbi:hypothetical protein BZG36_03080 [Bifiguratus adelaidae]|uniref:Methyltransferase domain-containing protein n=1 Tax=Bifiguratus adelaidae TaxID=1938954 RepID=A0A261XZH6_9FUNG|nr:hypothetical protein BZG36_03080 [Bifiguratus adelaidae]
MTRSTSRGSTDIITFTSPTETVGEKPKFVYSEHNRRYHNDDAPYVLPNDDSEVTRARVSLPDALGFGWVSGWNADQNLRLKSDRDFHAPIREKLESGANVLDIGFCGCGPGTWVLEMATEFPESHFTGIDISAIFLETIRPRNSEFKEANSLKGLPFPDNHFDFVYQGYLLGGYTASNWTFVMSEIKRVTKPVYVVLKERDIDIDIGQKVPSLLRQCSDKPDASFSFDYRSLHIGSGGRLGEMWPNQLKIVFGGVHQLFEAKYGKMTQQEFRGRLDKAVDECAASKAYTNFYFEYVQVIKA